jgi:23S rRNA (uracil-5-)-methyltransferase RumA
MSTTTLPRCKHFGQCGGCAFQDRAYLREQLELKKKSLESLFGRPVEVVPSPLAYGYRNRMDFVCAFGKIGLREKGRFNRVVEIDQCLLLPDRAADLFRLLKEGVRANGIPDFNYLNHQGYLRYITLRVAANTPDIMVNFVTATEEEKLMPLLEIARDLASSINWIVQPALADLSYGPIWKSFGQPFFTEKAGPRVYCAGPNTFTQNNALLAPCLFEYIRGHVEGRVLDLYCGMGAISLYVADGVKEVIGVEQEGEALKYAAENRRINGIDNVSFISADVRQYLVENEKTEKFDTVIIDPPRSGLGAKVARKILRMGPKRIVYVSCNPKALAEDLETFIQHYDLEEVRGFDMFPQTPHVEGVIILNKINKN